MHELSLLPTSDSSLLTRRASESDVVLSQHGHQRHFRSFSSVCGCCDCRSLQHLGWNSSIRSGSRPLVRESRYSAYSDFLVAIDAWHEATTADWIEARFGGAAELASHRASTAVLAQELNRSQSKVALIRSRRCARVRRSTPSAAVEPAELAQSVNSLEDLERVVPLLDLSEITEHRATLLGLMNYAIGPRRRFQPRFRRVESSPYRRPFTSNASRNPSPKKLTARVTVTIASPGAAATHGW